VEAVVADAAVVPINSCSSLGPRVYNSIEKKVPTIDANFIAVSTVVIVFGRFCCSSTCSFCFVAAVAAAAVVASSYPHVLPRPPN
jgi:hypothetical protein